MSKKKRNAKLSQKKKKTTKTGGGKFIRKARKEIRNKKTGARKKPQKLTAKNKVKFSKRPRNTKTRKRNNVTKKSIDKQPLKFTRESKKDFRIDFSIKDNGKKIKELNKSAIDGIEYFLIKKPRSLVIILKIKKPKQQQKDKDDSHVWISEPYPLEAVINKRNIRQAVNVVISEYNNKMIEVLEQSDAVKKIWNLETIYLRFIYSFKK
jgi:hypothetical protein